MTFGAVFPRVFGPAFGPGLAQAAAAGGWWLTGGIAAANCIAAYQPKGAASLAASYVNLANPGTNDATVGVAPTLAAGGWVLNGSTQYLIVPPIGTGYSAIVQFTAALSSGTRAVFGTYQGFNNNAAIYPNNGSQVNYFFGGVSARVNVGPQLLAGNLALTPTGGWRNGTKEATLSSSAGSAINTFVGCWNQAGSPANHLSVTVAAMAIYNIDISSYMASLVAAMAAP